MKKILYFIFALITIAYLAFMCYANLVGFENLSEVLVYIATYGGLFIALLYAAVNFFGSPLKIVFFVLLVVMTVLLILTIVIPDVFRDLFKMGEAASSFVNCIK